MNFSFASATQQHYSNATNVTQIDLPTGTGMMGVLAAGWATVYDNTGTSRFFVSSGSYTVNADGSVTIAAEEAIPESEICMDSARAALNEFKQTQSSSKSEQERNDAQIAAETLE